MNIVVIGRKGQLASELALLQSESNWQLVCAGRDDIDILQQSSIFQYLYDHKADIVINTAAYTEVDKAESEQEQAFSINQTAAENIAAVAAKKVIPCLYISTDYVFDGNASIPYKENDSVNPLGIYGKSKLAGEIAVRKQLTEHIIIRTSWLYSSYGKNFVKTILKLISEREVINVVDDQVGCPTYAYDLAISIKKIILQLTQEHGSYGTYHLSGSGSTSWYEFAKAIQKSASKQFGTSWRGINCMIQPISTKSYQFKAPRPLYSPLDNSKIEKNFGIALPHWNVGLDNCINEIYAQGAL